MSQEEVTYSDDARVGLVREIMQIIFGLEPEVEDRVMSLIRGSVDSQDIKTPEMRQRIGNRAMKYLTNAIDLARNEGAELHNQDPTLDVSKSTRGDMEPGHQHDRGVREENNMINGFSFKTFLTELNMDIDLNDPQAATMKIKRAAQMGGNRAAIEQGKQAQNDMRTARDADPNDPTRQLDMKIANLTNQLALLQKRKSQMMRSQGAQGGGEMQ